MSSRGPCCAVSALGTGHSDCCQRSAWTGELGQDPWARMKHSIVSTFQPSTTLALPRYLCMARRWPQAAAAQRMQARLSTNSTVAFCRSTFKIGCSCESSKTTTSRAPRSPVQQPRRHPSRRLTRPHTSESVPPPAPVLGRELCSNMPRSERVSITHLGLQSAKP